MGTSCVRFNGSGTQLLCIDVCELVVYDLPTRHQLPAANGKVFFKEPSLKNGIYNEVLDCCFAGIEDELVISANARSSYDLVIWPIPERQQDQKHITVDNSLRVLSGHQKTINCVRYNSVESLIVSSDDNGLIKVWTPSATKYKKL